MYESEELRQLRREVDDLLRKAAALAARIDRMEKESATEPEPREAVLERVREIRSEAVSPPPTTPVAKTEETPAARETAAVVPPPPKRAVEQPRVVPPPMPVTAVRPIVPGPRPVPVPVATGPTLAERLREKLQMPEEGAPRDRWEVWITTYLIPRAAVLTMALAAAFFLGWAVDKISKHGPYGRIAIGYAAFVMMLAAAWLMERRNYRDFARVLYSGAFVLSYSVTYATHYISYTRIFDQPYVTLALLAIVVVAWAAAAQWRQSRTMALFVTVLAHLTTFLTAHAGERETALFAAIGILLLSAGSAFFLLRNGWYYVASAGVVGSYLNMAAWMYYNQGQHLTRDFYVTLGLLSAFYLVYAFAEILSRDSVRRSVPTWFRTSLVTLNSAGFLLLGRTLFIDFQYETEWLYFGFALVLLAFSLAYLKLRPGDILYNAYFTKAVAVATLGLAVYYDGTVLSAWLAVETVVLLFAARRSGLLISRLLALAVGAIAFGHGLFTAANAGALPYAADGYMTVAVGAAATVLGLLLSSLVYQFTDWDVRSPRRIAFFDADTNFLMWQMGFVSEQPQGFENRERPLKGLLFPYMYAFAAFMLMLGYAPDLIQPGHRTLAFALGALVLTAAAAGLASEAYGSVSMLLFASALIAGALEMAGSADAARGLAELGLPEDLAGYASTLIMSVALQAMAVTALFSERRLGGTRPGLVYHRQAPSPYFLYGATAWLLGLLLLREMPPLQESLALLGAGVIAAGLTLVLHPRALAVVSTGFVVWGQMQWMSVPDPSPVSLSLWELTAWLLVLFPLLADRFFALDLREARLRIAGWILVPATWLVTVDYLLDRVDEGWRPFAIAFSAFAFLAYGLAFRSRPAALVSIGSGLIASLGASFHASGLMPKPDKYALFFDFAGPVAFWIACDRLNGLGSRRLILPVTRALPAAALAIADLLLLHYLTEPVKEGWYGFAVAALAFAFLAYGGLLRSRAAVAIAIADAVLASLIMFTGAYTTPQGLATAPLVAGFVACAVFWLVTERLYAHVEDRLVADNPYKSFADFAVYTAAALLVLMLAKVPSLKEHYLTISWTLLAFAFFGMAILFRVRPYRYAGLALMALSFARAYFIESRREGLMRVAAFAVLSLALFLLTYGYLKAKDFILQNETEEKPEEQPPTA